MKKLTLLFLLFSGIVKASNFNSSFELAYIYVTFIVVVLIIVSTDQVLKYVFKKLKEREEKLHEQTTLDHFEE